MTVLGSPVSEIAAALAVSFAMLLAIIAHLSRGSGLAWVAWPLGAVAAAFLVRAMLIVRDAAVTPGALLTLAVQVIAAAVVVLGLLKRRRA